MAGSSKVWLLQKHIGLQLNQARGVAVHPNGDIAVADIGSKQVFIYNRSGDVKFGMKSPSTSDSHGIAVSAHGRYFVTGLNQYVEVFNAEGAFQYKFAAKSPSNVASDREVTKLIGITVNYNTQHVFVGDTNNKYISMHQLDGTHISSIKVDLEPWYILITDQSKIVVSSYEDHAVHMVNLDGKVLYRCSIPTGLEKHQWCPTGMCLVQNTIFVNNFSKTHSGVYTFSPLSGAYLGRAIDNVAWPTGIAAVNDGGLLKLMIVQGKWSNSDTGVKIFE